MSAWLELKVHMGKNEMELIRLNKIASDKRLNAKKFLGRGNCNCENFYLQ